MEKSVRSAVVRSERGICCFVWNLIKVALRGDLDPCFFAASEIRRPYASTGIYLEKVEKQRYWRWWSGSCDCGWAAEDQAYVVFVGCCVRVLVFRLDFRSKQRCFSKFDFVMEL